MFRANLLVCSAIAILLRHCHYAPPLPLCSAIASYLLVCCATTLLRHCHVAAPLLQCCVRAMVLRQKPRISCANATKWKEQTETASSEPPCFANSTLLLHCNFATAKTTYLQHYSPPPLKTATKYEISSRVQDFRGIPVYKVYSRMVQSTQLGACGEGSYCSWSHS